MRYPIRILTVEDSKDWRKALKEHLRERFDHFRHYRDVTIDTAEDGDEALGFLLENRKYDFVALDINLASGTKGAPGPSGLDVIEEIEMRKAAFFVALVTGAATDPTLEQRYGVDAAAVMQVGLQCEAARYFPPERIRVVNKPPQGLFTAQWKSVAKALDGVIEAFEYAAAWRYVFRPMNHKGKFWELRWNGGPFVRIPDMAGFAEIRYVLKSVDREDELSVVEMMSRVQEVLPRRRGGGALAYGGKAGKASVRENTPDKKVTLVFDDVLERLEEEWKDRGIDEASLQRWHECFGTQQFKKLYEALGKHFTEDSDLLRAITATIKEANGQIFPSKVRLVPRQEGKQDRPDDHHDANHENMLAAFRQQWKRVKAKLQEVGLSEMAQHFEEAIDRGSRNPGRCLYAMNLAVRWVLD